ncbi:single-stranded DNA-binding protein [Microbacterium flavum]|uniref:Single-stranded DNA-binding protein n=1 Tax=Microbacterium flavum TaxID=415216 RepID=A0ABS5XY55_9MICO|nr:single-stranded DNA-binding protein [Microbacterium flavum]MBT8798862.1 single-stranded DNA-binding protein [Microbacterium flavum]
MTDTIAITGNLTSAPERVPISGDVTMVKFGLASTERRFADGGWSDVHTNFYNVSAFRKLAENALASLERGQRVIVVGKLKVRTWESNGRTGTSVDIEASSIGPDLMFGVATFSRSTRSGGAEAVRREAESTDAGEWAAPGTVAGHDADRPAAERTGDESSDVRPDGEPELIGASGWAARDETPF